MRTAYPTAEAVATATLTPRLGSCIDVGTGTQVRVAWLDAEGASGTVVCEVSPGCCLQMSPSAYWLLANLRKGLTPVEISSLAERTFGQRLDTDELVSVCDTIISKVDEQTRLAEAKRRRRYLFRIRILPEAVVGSLAKRMHAAFTRQAGICYAALIVAAVVAQAATDGPAQMLRHIGSGNALLIAYLVYLLSLIAHEFGHATASSRYGVKPGSIGFAVYLAFPALYCDVTRAWLLPRRQRVVVDISGIIFEIAIGAVFALVGGAFHQWIFTAAAFLVLGNLTWALNPFGRFDMYWTLSDALGVTNLRSEGGRVLRELAGRRSTEKPGPSVRHWRKGVVLAYSVLSLLMIGSFIYFAIRVDIPLISQLPLIIRVIGDEAMNGHAGAALNTAIGPIMMLTLLAVMLYRAIKSALRSLAKAIRLRLDAAQSSL
jgi:putative peptide zinc metalloprotease protein